MRRFPFLEIFDFTEAATGGVLYEKVFIEILQLFFNKVVGLRPATLLKKRLQHRCYPVNFAKFPRLVEFSMLYYTKLLKVDEDMMCKSPNTYKINEAGKIAII